MASGFGPTSELRNYLPIQAYGFTRPDGQFLYRPTRDENGRKLRNVGTVVARFTFDCERIRTLHGFCSFRPVCFRIARHVPGRTSSPSFPEITVTGPSAARYIRWSPVVLTWLHAASAQRLADQTSEHQTPFDGDTCFTLISGQNNAQAEGASPADCALNREPFSEDVRKMAIGSWPTTAQPAELRPMPRRPIRNPALTRCGPAPCGRRFISPRSGRVRGLFSLDRSRTPGCASPARRLAVGRGRPAGSPSDFVIHRFLRTRAASWRLSSR